METKKILLSAINTVITLDNYKPTDCIFSQKYAISPTAMVYILLQLSKDFNFTINDAFVDALEMCTFAQLEQLLEQHANTAA